MDIDRLRDRNEELRKQVITSLRELGDAPVFESYVEQYIEILSKIDTLSYDLDDLETRIEQEGTDLLST